MDKHCEICKWWSQQYIEEVSYMLGDGLTSAKTDKREEPAKANTKTSYGLCRKAIVVEDGTDPTNRLHALIGRNVAMILETADGAALYTNKDHCCLAWTTQE